MSDLSSHTRSPGLQPQRPEPASPLKRLVIGLVLITIVVGSLGVFVLFNTRTQTLKQAEDTSKMLAGILNQSIGSLFQKTDMTIRNVADEVVHQTATGGIQTEILNKFIERQFGVMPELDSLRISDAHGMVTFGSGHFPSVPLNIRDRDYFMYLRNHPAADMVLSKPIIDTISKKEVLICARRITLTDGSFGGIVYAILPVQQFNDIFKGIPIGERGTLSLCRDDLSLIVRYAAAHSQKDESLTASTRIPDVWRTLLNQGATQTGSYTSDSTTDGIKRIYSYNRIPSYSLYVNVGLAQDDVLADARKELFVVAAFFSCFLLMAGILIWLTNRNWQKTVAAEKELKRNYERLELMQEVSQYQAANVQELLEFSLEKVIALTESGIGYIYHYSEEDQQFVLNTWSKHVMEACSVTEPQSLYQLEKTGIWGEVVRQRKPIIINDYAAAHPLKKGYPEGHVSLSRFLSIPIFDNNRIIAVVGVANKVLPYDQTDVLQLTLMLEGVWKIATRLKLVEQISRAGQEWQNTFDAINDSIALINTDQQILRCNHSTCTLLGREFGDIINQPCWKLFHGTEAPLPDCPMNRAKHSLHSETATYKRKDRWLEVSVDPQLSESGVLISAVHIVRDVTERVSLVNSLQEEKELYKDLVDTQPAGMYRLRMNPLTDCPADGWREALNTHYSVDMVSDRFCHILGIDAQAFRENPGLVPDLVFSEDRADFIEKNLEAATNLRSFKWEGRFGTEQNFTWVRFESVPRTLTNGEVLWTGVISDISDYKRSEESLRDIQAQLMQNDKLATIGQLAAGVAHEINNPMGFVGSNMATLAKYIVKYNRYIDQIEQELRSCLAGVLPEQILLLRQSLKLDYIMKDISVLLDENNEGIDRVKRIVQDLRTFSRADSSSIASADLNSCMESTVNIVINEIKYVAELKREYGNLPKVSCNAQQINQVFMNLLINAAHAIQAKGDQVGEIVIRTWCDQDNAFVSVTDNGCGIPPENRSKIFDAFYTTKEVGKGTGLGLSISAGIIRKHGGEITLSSEVGVGSAFAIRLPLQPAQCADKDLQ